MSKRVCEALAVAVIAVAAVAESAVESAPVLIRGFECGRVWQTDFSPDKPLGWYWGRADSAEVSVVDYGRNRSIAGVYAVERADNETFGSFVLPLPRDFAAGGEGLYDVTLTLRKNGAVLSAETARIARVHDVSGTSVDIIPSTDGKWGELTGRGILAYDTGWHGERSAAVSFTVEQGDASRDVPLEGTGGYAPLDLAAEGPAKVSLVFDGTGYASSLLWRKIVGMKLLLR